jgi:membrane protease YdiL (CAAX protease family)
MLFLGIAIGCMSLAAIFRATSSGASASAHLDAVVHDPVNILLAQLAATLISLSIGFRWLAIVDFKDALAIRSVSLREITLAAILGMGLQFPLTELTNLLYSWFPVSVEDQVAYQQLLHPKHWLIGSITALAIVGVAPVGEELLFRGLIFRGLIPSYRPFGATLISASLFGLAHMGPTRFIYATLVGIVLAMVLYRTASIIPAITAHAAFNAVPLLLPSTLIRIPGFNIVSAEIEHVPWLLVVTSSILFAVAFFFLVRYPTQHHVLEKSMSQE